MPFFVVAPETTIDLSTPSGEHIEIEDRAEEEIVSVRGVRLAPAAPGP
ncbi:hypothetical protein [Nonomuraea dietziae]